jgi:hypothetical protein
MISEKLRNDMLAKGIDIELSLSILEGLNSGSQAPAPALKASGVPKVDGVSVLSVYGELRYALPRELASQRLAALGLEPPAGFSIRGEQASFGREELNDIGERMYALTAWGVLNGGSATSYADRKKNSGLGPGVFEAIKAGFDALAPLCEGRPKGVTPAYINPDGSPGESFLVLKMRSALLKALRYRERFGPAARPPLQFFQMTSAGTDAPLRDAYAGYRRHPWLAPLIDSAGSDPTQPLSAVQPLIAALSPASEGSPRRIFDRAYGKMDSALALPGGHGQSFRVLAGVYRELLAKGYRYAYIGNVDNVGYSVDPVELALMALSGADAAFDFSYRTALDVKGGILVLDERGAMTVGDLGQAISNEEAEALEAGGERILFNCATGLFDLAALVARLDDIAATLPLRISEQDKDAGRYSQAEQSTWEVVGILKRPLGFAVDKSERFLAAKLLAETILGSGSVPAEKLPPELAASARSLSEGLNKALSGHCGLALRGGRWEATAS